MKRSSFFFLALVFGQVALGTTTDVFEQGNNAYQAGNFAEAKERYESLALAGNGGLALSYNLGNTYYRLGKMGQARLWYERAVEAAPRDEDARYNRDLVRERVGENETATDGLRSLAGILWILASVANLMFFALLAMGLFRDSEWVWWGRWVMGISFVVCLTAAWAAQKQMAVPYGVVIVDRAEARTGPSVQEQVGFVAPEGHRVVILDRLNDWVQIGVPAKGLKGWVSHNTIASVRPPLKQIPEKEYIQ